MARRRSSTRWEGRALPPVITTGDPGSYAMRTIVERKPRIIDEVIEANALAGPRREKLEALRDELRNGSIANPLNGAGFPPGAFEEEELSVWESEIARHQGRSWLQVPWYFAESFFYLKLLLCTGYYDGRPAADPFQPLKERELFGPSGGISLGRRLAGSLAGQTAREDALERLLHSSLWGNRVDLSTFDVATRERLSLERGGEADLLIDDTSRVAKALLGARRVDMILDNAGPELVSDLLLADFLLFTVDGARVVFHLKRAPYFVSDAMTKDVQATIGAFISDADSLLRAAGLRLKEAMDRGSLTLSDHFFWNGPLHFTGMPGGIRRSLAESDIVLVKGDANYRRLLHDRMWKTDEVMEEAASSFPAPFAVLRTMKSEIVVDLPPGRAQELSRADPDWMTNGKRGIIRYCKPR